MKSITTKPNIAGWYYTFQKRKDGSIILVNKNKNKDRIWRHISIHDQEILKAFYEVVNSKV